MSQERYPVGTIFYQSDQPEGKDAWTVVEYPFSDLPDIFYAHATCRGENGWRVTQVGGELGQGAVHKVVATLSPEELAVALERGRTEVYANLQVR